MGKGSQRPGKVFVGTASWSDPGFIEHWYPKSLLAGERLAWYARHFETVEVNSTFYAIPDDRTTERWCRATPDPFIFDVKMHRLLSRHSTEVKSLPPRLQSVAHMESKGRVKLTAEMEAAMIEEFLRPVEILRQAGKLGALLLQLSPAFSPRRHELSELDALLEAFRAHRVAVEFRNRNWMEGAQLADTLSFLRGHSATLVSVDAPAQAHFTIMPGDMDEITNSRMAYLRLHGRNAAAYLRGKTVASRFDYDYSDGEIAEGAERTRRLAHGANEVHVIFNNNNLDYAPRAALRLRAALGQIIGSPPRQGELFGKRATRRSVPPGK